MSRAARRAMVRRPDPELSLSRQCRLLSIIHLKQAAKLSTNRDHLRHCVALIEFSTKTCVFMELSANKVAHSNEHST